MPLTIEDIAVFCKRKGFVYPNSEIYGGMAGFFDYGPLGVELKDNIKREFWKAFVQQRDDVVGMEGAIIAHPRVWQASGHVDSFRDTLMKCRKCGYITKEEEKCPKCNIKLEKSKEVNLMFSTNVGAVGGSTAYLRPETAQLIFTNFKLIQENSRKKLPFGIAQLGKAFRNEISPRDFLFRSREFEQFEIEFFVHPEKTNECSIKKEIENLKVNILTAEMQSRNKEHEEMTIKQIIEKKIGSEWHAYWLGMFYKFFLNFGIRKENLRIREHLKSELAHYAKACFDIEYNFPFGWKEIHGNADRGQYDLKQHTEFSKKDLSYFDEESKKRVLPYVAAEPSQGIDRAFLAFITDAYSYDKKRENIILKLHPKLAPVKVAVFPLVNKLDKQAKKIYDGLKNEFSCVYDRSGSIGRRYARQDESGTPICITVDFETKENSTVTLRDRNTTKQARVKINKLKEELGKIINNDDYGIFKKG